MSARIISILCLATAPMMAADLSKELAALRAVGPEGKGNDEAAAAWKTVAAAPAETLPALLAAMDGANGLAENWLRAAAGVMADRAVTANRPLPVAAVKTFLVDTKHTPHARRLAFEMIQRADVAEAEKLIPTFLNDPAPELRREPVGRLLDEGKKQATAKNAAAVATLMKAFDSARDEDQITQIVDQLKELGQKPEVAHHLGLLIDWHLIGPFDNTGRGGFDQAFPPEKEIKLDATYPGKGAQAKWVPFSSKDDYGNIDFNKPFGLLKEVTGYAVTNFDAAEERDAEIRLGCKDAWKVWFNGQLLFARDEYHRGAMLDQYKLPCRLKKGKNTILVKCCQNEQTEPWTVEWEFKLRICDATGTAIQPAGAK